MYLKKLSLRNIRALREVDLDFARGTEAGWHVILGPNGSGKSSLIRSIALLLMGEKEAYASRSPLKGWISQTATQASISASLSYDPKFDSLVGGGKPPQKPITAEVKLRSTGYENPVADQSQRAVDFSGSLTQRTIWGGGAGWFSASFGPYRRFTGGDRAYDKMFYTNKRLAPHLTSFGEDVALTDALVWLTTLYGRQLDDEKRQKHSDAGELLEIVTKLINANNLLPHGAVISGVSTVDVTVTDGNGASVVLDQLSDGYRSALSLVLELLRQMSELYGERGLLDSVSPDHRSILAPGIVAIDEVDVHLHPTWQATIGGWLTACFPMVQFLVTTHSPLVCRSILSSSGTLRGSVWQLPVPGSPGKEVRRLQGNDLAQLVYGDVLEALDTGAFGNGLERSQYGNVLLHRLASLNVKALDENLSSDETEERRSLRAIFPVSAGTLTATDA